MHPYCVLAIVWSVGMVWTSDEIKSRFQDWISSCKIMKGSQVIRQTRWRLQKWKLEVLIISWVRLWLQVRLYSIFYNLDTMVANWAFFFVAIALSTSLFSSALSFGSANPTTRVRRATALVVYSWGSVFDASFLTGVLNLTSHTWNQKPHTQKKKRKKKPRHLKSTEEEIHFSNKIFILKIVKLRNQANWHHSMVIQENKKTQWMTHLTLTHTSH